MWFVVRCGRDHGLVRSTGTASGSHLASLGPPVLHNDGVQADESGVAPSRQGRSARARRCSFRALSPCAALRAPVQGAHTCEFAQGELLSSVDTKYQIEASPAKEQDTLKASSALKLLEDYSQSYFSALLTELRPPKISPEDFVELVTPPTPEPPLLRCEKKPLLSCALLASCPCSWFQVERVEKLQRSHLREPTGEQARPARVQLS